MSASIEKSFEKFPEKLQEKLPEKILSEFQGQNLRRRSRILSLTLALSVVGFSGCGKPQSNDEDLSTSESYGSSPASQTGIDNFRKVESGLYRSGKPEGQDFARLGALGIKTILSLEDYGGSTQLKNQEAARAAAYGIKLVWVPMSPSARPTLTQIKKALETVENLNLRPLLIHCKHGLDRTGIVVASYKIKNKHFSVNRAKTEMRQLGHYPSLYFWDSILDEFASGLTGSGQTIASNSSNTDESNSASPAVVAPQESSAPVDIIGDIALNTSNHAQYGVPKMKGQPEVLISRTQYLLSWNKSRRLLNWAAWELSSDNLGSVGRANDFNVDEDLQNYLRANGGAKAVGPSEFSSSCLDRGHQVPSADRTKSETDNQATFVMSNMVPQAAYMNRVIWEHLETHERSLTRGSHGSKLFIIAGPIFPANPKKIGPRGDIPVPTKNFKIIARVSGSGSSKTLTVVNAVIVPNITSKGTDPVVDRDQACEDSDGVTLQTSGQVPSNVWTQYQASISQIEQEAGVNLGFLN